MVFDGPFNGLRPLQNPAFYPISASGSTFNPQNTQCIPVVKIFAFLELEQKSTFFKGLGLGAVEFEFAFSQNVMQMQNA